MYRGWTKIMEKAAKKKKNTHFFINMELGHQWHVTQRVSLE
jgi:hypothetical protein